MNKANAINPLGHDGPKKERKPGSEEEKQEENKDAGGQETEESPWAGAEAFAVKGLLAGALSPETQKAFEGLARQLEPLRAELVRAKGREEHFRELAENHSFLPVPGRREFLRELTHVISHMEDFSPAPSLILLHITNADEIRRHAGRKALDEALIHVCTVIDQVIDPTDVVGSLGGNDLGVIQLVGGPDMTRIKAHTLTEAVLAKPFACLGRQIKLEVASGNTALEK
ncbi:MAG: diguanylate cyclase, partial [Proteobacteria bacterium]|nr:diguanylate cyclase [Pseudomonadota bacterium]